MATKVPTWAEFMQRNNTTSTNTGGLATSSGYGRPGINDGGAGSNQVQNNSNAVDLGGSTTNNPAPNTGMTGAQMGGLALGALNTMMAYKQYGLAKDQFAHNKQMALANYDANRVQANNSINRTNSINNTVNNKANSLAVAAGGTANNTYSNKSLVKSL